MKQLCPVLILVLLTAELSNSQSRPNYEVKNKILNSLVSVPCCGVKIVAGQGDLDDRYELVREGSEKPEDICADGCIYKRESIPVDEYCFLNKETTGSVVCQVLMFIIDFCCVKIKHKHLYIRNFQIYSSRWN